MQNDRLIVILVSLLTLISCSVGNIKAFQNKSFWKTLESELSYCRRLVETLAQEKDDAHITREAIEELRCNLKKVLHFIDDLSGDIAGGNQTTAERGRAHIPPPKKLVGHLLADESVVKATAKKAAKAVKESLAATLKTQQGIKIISKGLVELKKCLKTFEKTVKV